MLPRRDEAIHRLFLNMTAPLVDTKPRSFYRKTCWMKTLSTFSLTIVTPQGEEKPAGCQFANTADCGGLELINAPVCRCFITTPGYTIMP
jgi:hypothetical protein